MSIITANINKYSIYIIFIALTLVPPFIFMVFRTSSFCMGLIIALIICLSSSVLKIRNSRIKTPIKEIALISLIFLVIFIASLPGIVINNFSNINKSLPSLIVLYLECLSLLFISNAFTLQKAITTKKAALHILIIFILIAFATQFGIGPIVQGDYVKPMIIFSEYSHFILALSPLYLFTIVTCSKKQMLCLIAFLGLFNIVFKSLTGVCLMVLSLFLILSIRNFIIIFVLAVVLIFNFTGSYYTERIIFNEKEPNLSTLVWQSGWERAWLEFEKSFGFGCGFQNFGYNNLIGSFMNDIINIYGHSFNIYDGGSLATKIIAELGVLGIAIILAYLYLFVKLVISIRKIAIKNQTIKKSELLFIFYSSLIISYSLELFIRGVGYYSTGTMFFILGLILFFKNKKNVRFTYHYTNPQ